jgi:hypothetical protein
MGNRLRRLVVLSSAVAKRRKFELLAASCLVPLTLGLSEPALAGTCTADASGNLDCSGSFVANINNNANITLQPGVTVASPGGDAVNAANNPPANPAVDITITANDPVTINNNQSVGSNTGLRIQSSGAAIINATNTTIGVGGLDSDWAIWAIAQPNTLGTSQLASVTWNGPQLTTGGVGIPSGNESGGIQADNRGIGNATIDASGNITVFPGRTGHYGLIAHAGDTENGAHPAGAGSASVLYRSGTINAFGDTPRGIVVWAQGDGSASVTTGPGTVINVIGSNNPGVTPRIYL